MTDCRSTSSLRPLIDPRSVAVIGASDTTGKIGASAFAYQGVKAYPRVQDVPGDVDLSVFAVPAAALPSALDDAIAKGVKASVVFTSGFAELGEDGSRVQRALAVKATKAGMRLLGPNCLGIVNYTTRMVASFSPFFAQLPDAPGHAALISQSGAFGGYAAMAARDAGLAFNCWMTTGNEADIDLADGLSYFAEDDQTRVILAYMEGCRDGRKLIQALEACRRNRKPIVMLKVGRTEIGAAAAASHTASLAGSDEVYDGIFRQFGVYRAKSLDEWLDVGRAAAQGCYPRSNRVALVTASGGVGVFMADEAQPCGLDVAPLSSKAQADIRGIIDFAGTRNPVDVTGQALTDIGLFERTIDVIMREGTYDSIVAFHAGIGQSPVAGKRLQDAWANVRRDNSQIVVAVSGASTPEFDAAYEAAGCLAFQDPGRAVRAVGALNNLAQAFDRVADRSTEAAPQPLGRTGPFSEVEALALLQDAGLPVVPHRLVTSPALARSAGDALGYPVVLKIVSPDILHKTEIGGVVLAIADGDGLEAAFSTMIEKVKALAPEARIDGCLVAPMMRGGIETILGVQHDAVFGPIIMFGLGGVLVEVLRDVTFRAAPFDEAEAGRMIEATKASAVLRGVRGRGPSDVPALARALSKLSQFAAVHADDIASVDLNPFVVFPEGSGACALDAVIVVQPLQDALR